MAPPESSFYTIRGRPGDSPADGFSSADSAYGSQVGGPCSSPPRKETHNISRAKYHMGDIGEFAKSLEMSASKAFPNTLRNSRYTKVKTLLLHWESDDLFVLPEVQDLGKCFDEVYHFGVEYFTIPVENSHLELMMKIGLFLKECESPDTLLVVYYGGHARIDESRQSTWCATRERESPWLQWSAIQTLLERSPSDVLILLDCCAGAASATFPNGQSVTETISASSWDAIAPDPGRYSFTSTLIEVMSDWENKAFSAAMLHAEVLARLKHPRPELRNGRHYEARSTPVHFMMTANHRKPSIELCKVKEQEAIAESPGLPALPGPVESPGIPTPSDPVGIPIRQRAADPTSDPVNDVGLYEKEPSIETPHVMLSLALERDQRLDIKAWEQWLSQFPALAKYVKVQGVFESHSTLLLLSLPVSIWSMLPEHDACNFVAFIRSNNLMVEPDAQQPEVSPQPVITDSMMEHGSPENVHRDGDSVFTSLTGSTAVVRVDDHQAHTQSQQHQEQPQQQQQHTSPVISSRPELSRSRSQVGLPGPELRDSNTPTQPLTRSGTTANILNRTLRKAVNMGSTLSLPQTSRSSGGSVIRRSPSATSLQPVQPQAPQPSSSSAASMAYQPIMTQARATRRTNFHGNDIAEKPNFSDHVEAYMEDFYNTRTPYPNDGFKETLASSTGVESRDVALWFHHRRSEDRVTKRFENMKMEDGSPALAAAPLDSPISSVLPATPQMILPGNLSKLLSFLPLSQLLIIDVRNPPQYQKAHIYSAINLRVPARVLNVATKDMMMNSLHNDDERRIFGKWRQTKCVLFYDRKAEYSWEVPQAETLTRWWRSHDPAWAGRAFILKGPYKEVELNHEKYIVKAEMSDEARAWVKSVEESEFTSEDLNAINAKYEGWLSQLADEERVPQSSLQPNKEVERVEQLDGKQKIMEKEFATEKPKTWEKALSLQPADDVPFPELLPRSYSESAATGKGKMVNESTQAALVEPLSRGLEKARQAGNAPQQPSAKAQQGGKLFPSYSTSGKMALEQQSSAQISPQPAKKSGKAPLYDDKEYDMVENEDEEEVIKPSGRGSTVGAVGSVGKSFKPGKWFRRS
ncbi:Rhodanese-like protein [Zalerion maritima]|uniref:Rhodanese-like protein n=1 Tax=Zalerion maritima TaxID=339359 RepID=A0AAD5RZ90_9PEZI|nr:Rhodanese-like protein [Zalerion maritima]